MFTRRLMVVIATTAMGAAATLVLSTGPAHANGCITPAAGTADDPFLISTASNLLCLMNDDVYWTGDKHFRQTTDIDLTGLPHAPIGDGTTSFDGAYDGDGHSITGLDLTGSASETRVGLFGSTDGAELQGIRVSGRLEGERFVGGLVGIATNTTVTECTASVDIVANEIVQGQDFGGLVGRLDGGSISSSSASGSLSQGIPMPTFLGGLVGVVKSGAVVADSFATGDVSGHSTLGGLVGRVADSTIVRSFSSGEVRGDNNVGGFAGQLSNASVQDVYARGTSSGTGSSGDIGGLLGDASSSTVTNAYTTGLVSLGLARGGVVPSSSSGTWLGTFWNVTTTEVSTATSTGSLSGTTGETTSAMTDITTYQAAGWNIGSWALSGTTWGICSRVNDGYPYLQAFYASDPCPANAGPPPPPWHQAYSRGVGDTCLAGWNPSWAQWPNGGTGGFVCNRTLVYNTSTGAWDARRLILAALAT